MEFLKTTLLILAIFAISRETEATECTDTPENVSGMTAVAIVAKKMAAMKCTDGKLFNTGDSFIATYCVDGAWQTLNNVQCPGGTTAETPSCTSTPPTVTGAATPVPKEAGKLLMYSCENNQQWLSGEPARISQCKGTEWTSVMDVCDEACEIPRDCDAVEQLGFKNSDYYVVVPSGNSLDTSHKVYCQLSNNDTEGGHWTTILRNYDQRGLIDASGSQYDINGFNDITTDATKPLDWLGLEALHQMTMDSDGTPRPHILEVLLTIGSTVFHATYGNFSVGSSTSTYPLISLGTYHGNAGDAMCPHMHMAFAKNGDNYGWWGEVATRTALIEEELGSFLTNKTIRWEPLKSNGTITEVNMRMRPVTFDETINCPPIEGLEPYWTTTTGDWPQNRSVGTVVEFECIGDLVVETVDPTKPRTSGSLECLDTFQWNDTVALPCMLQCPTGFVKSVDENRCYHFSTEAVDGLHQAVIKCIAMEATVGVVKDGRDFSTAVAGEKYFVANNILGGTVIPALPTGDPDAEIQCGGAACAFAEPNRCLTVSSVATEAENVNCSTTHKYICEAPGTCPNHYTRYKGGCYNATSPDTDELFLEVEAICNAESGGSIVYPTTMLTLDHIYNLFAVEFQDMGFFLAATNVTGDWSSGGLFPDLESDAALIDYLEYVGGDYRTLILQEGVSTMESASATSFEMGRVCQWPGIKGCLAPPEALADMTVQPTGLIEGTLAQEIVYECDYGFFMGGNVSRPNETVTCRGIMGGWQPAIETCVRVKVCENSFPDTPVEVTNVTDDDTVYLGGHVIYECPTGMAAPLTDPAPEQNLTCAENSTDPGNFIFEPEFVPCIYCLNGPEVENATTDYNNQTAQYVSDADLVTLTAPKTFVTATCNESHQYDPDMVEQNITCTASGWEMTDIKPCKIACTTDPAAGGANITRADITLRWPEEEVIYTCDTGTFLESNGTLPVATTTKAVCQWDGTWFMERGELDCYVLATAEPPAPPAGGATTSWAGNGTDSRREGTTVTYTCPDGQLFGNRSATVTVESVDGAWTVVPASEFICSPACIDDPPATMGGKPVEWDNLPTWVDEVLYYNCSTGEATSYGEFNTSIKCDATGTYVPVDSAHNLTTLDDVFDCQPACPGPPIDPPMLGYRNYSDDFTEGVSIAYTCPGYFDDGNLTIFINCTGGNWTIYDLPTCLATTSAGPTTEPPLTLPTENPPYEETTHYHIPTLQESMTDTDGVNATYTATDGPMGFGYAVQLESEQKQCLRQENFKVEDGLDKPCLADPIHCTDGVSFSIWMKRFYTQAEFLRLANPLPTDIQYILSTGGDKEGHPGISLFHHGIFLYAIVSTGEKVWETYTAGHMRNGTWNNIGIRWHPQKTLDSSYKPISGGLELFINMQSKSHIFDPIQTFTAPLKTGLAPPELMLGCHKTSTDLTYRHFADGEFDEFASWNRSLGDDNIINFMGGFVSSFEHVTAERMSEIMARVDLTSPSMFSSAMGLLLDMTENHVRPTNAPAATESSSSSSSSSSTADVFSPTPSGPGVRDQLTDAESLSRRESFLDIADRIYDKKILPNSLDQAAADPYLSSLKFASNLMAADSASVWKKMQENGSAGAADLMWNSMQFAREAFCRIKYDNDSTPFSIIKTFDNIVFVGEKMRYSEFKAKGKYVQRPNYNHIQLREIKEKWNQMYDIVRYATNVVNDNNCNERSICLITMVFDSYDDIGPTPINIANIPRGSSNAMEARLMAGYFSVDPAYTAAGTINTSAPLCEVDNYLMKKNKFYAKLENNNKVAAARQLKFHSEEVVTQIQTRRCAFWNDKLSDFGTFDTDGCHVVESTDMYTKCTCDRFGPMIVLGEIIEPPSVPDEPVWLMYVKIAMYTLSAILLVFYSIVIGYSGDLKEQFHLMGMNLSLSVLFGSIAMLVSDMHGIRDSRHMCTTISTLVHFFYVAAGAWVACIGHASFKAITSGVVSGKLNSYSCISWGMSLISVGVPYAIFTSELGTDPRCFITWENYGKAAFFIPQTVYVAMAYFFGVVVICNLSTPALRKENLIEDYGSFCRGAAFMMIYFAITWTFGVLAYMRFGLTVDFYPIFQVMNSMTGIIIFIFIGIASNRYRSVLVGKAKARREKIKNLAGINKSKPEDKGFEPVTNVPDTPSPSHGLSPPSRGQIAGRPGSRPVTPH